MIASSRLAMVAALGIALGAHGSGMVNLMDEEQIQIEAATGAAEVRLGSGFADMAAGTLTAEDAENTSQAPTTEAAKPTKATPSEPETQKTTAEPAEPEKAEPVPSETPKKVTAEESPPDTPVKTVATPPDPVKAAPTPASQTAETPPQDPVTEAKAEPALTQPPVQMFQAEQPDILPATAAVLTPPEPTKTTATPEVRNAKPAVVEPAKPTQARTAVQAEPAKQALTAEPSDNPAINTIRPPARPANLAATAPKPPPPQQAKSSAPQAARTRAARGQSSTNSRAGESTGSKTATAITTGNGGRSEAAGNAAASNYRGKVMRRLSRVRKPRVGTRGTATVSFTIAANGALAKLGLARSSGSERLDQAALQVIRRAAPFPKPPPGARRSFSIQIKGE